MTGNIKKSLNILGGELRLQLIVFSALVVFFLLSMTGIKVFRLDERLLPVTFILLYMLCISFVLPWQTNLKGGISSGYCRYYLSLPVKTWQLYFWPLLSRLLLISLFAVIVYVSYRLFFGYANEYYFYPKRLWMYTKISVILYLLIQAFAWTKDSFRNLHVYAIAAIIICSLACPWIISGVFNDIYFPLVAVGLAYIASCGVKNLRNGIVRYLPLIPTNASKLSRCKSVSFSSAITAQFYQEWKQTWFFMPVVFLSFMIIVISLMLKSARHYNFSNDIALFMQNYLFMVLILPLLGIIYMDNRGFRSGYIDNMPLSSASLAKIRYWCFLLSLSICWLILIGFAFCRFILQYNKLASGLQGAWPELCRSPYVLLWFGMMIVIWGLFMALFLASGYMYKRWFTGSLAVITLLAVFFIERDNIFSMESEETTYLVFVLMFMLIHVIKSGLIYLHNARLLSKIIFTVFAVFFCCGYTILVGHYWFLMALPFVIGSVYPLMAIRYKFSSRRSELPRTGFPWRYAAMFLLIFSLFAIYTCSVDRYQQNEFNAIINSYSREKQEYKYPQCSNIKIKEFIESNAPDRDTIIRNFNRYSQYSGGTLRTVIDSVQNLIRSNIEEKRYDQAFRYLLFQYQFSERFYSPGLYMTNEFSFMRQIYHHYQPGRKDLQILMSLQRGMLKKGFDIAKWRMIDAMEVLRPEYNSILYHRYRYMFSRKKYSTPYFTGFRRQFFSPLINSAKVYTANNLSHSIQCIDYLSGTGEDRFVMIHKLDRYIVNKYLYCVAALQRGIILTAVTQYRDKYGKIPDTLKYLVPEFLSDRELYVYKYGDNGATSFFVRPEEADIKYWYITSHGGG